jgi:RNA polymerase sigma factor (sigma-70 family)
LAPQVLGSLARRSGDFDAAEDAVQEALLKAALSWPRDGVPAKPRGWLLQTATRRMIDDRRSEQSRRKREALAALLEGPTTETVQEDDTLVVLFMCCHPALNPASAIALTLRAVGGLTTAEIANAFMVSEATMAQRISRAKQRIKTSGVRFGMPASDELGPRLRVVLHVLYLIFNEGYRSSTTRELQRPELSDEAIRLTRMLHWMLPEDSEVRGLLALMLLLDARRPAQTDVAGDVIPLAEQDRALWDRNLISEGVALLNGAIGNGPVGEYQVQAAIAAIHDRAVSADETDWPQILGLYELLEGVTGNPVVTLNKAVATALVHGPAAGLAIVDSVAERLRGHHRLDAVRGHLLEMAGERTAAAEHYRAAASLTTSLPGQRYLAMRAARLQAGSPRLSKS